jgi:hypothetical protein
VWFVDEVPKGATGKILRRKVRVPRTRPRPDDTARKRPSDHVPSRDDAMTELDQAIQTIHGPAQPLAHRISAVSTSQPQKRNPNDHLNRAPIGDKRCT